MRKHPHVKSILSLGLLATACSNAPSPDARKGGTGEEPVASQRHAEIGNLTWGYARVSAAGTADANYSSPGVSAAQYDTGAYVVTMANLANSDPNGIQGSVQVAALGTDNTRCQASSEASGAFASSPSDNVPTDVMFNVQCVAPDGTPRDAPFAATFVRRTDVTGIEGGYVGLDPAWGFPLWFSANGNGDNWTDGLDYVAAHWNSTGGLITVQQYGAGVYEVVFAGQNADVGGTAEVTAIDSNRDGHYCELVDWYSDGSDQHVDVYCFDARGDTDDSPFNLRWTIANPTLAGGYGYAYADNATPASIYVPDLQYQRGFDGCNSTPAVTIEPFGPQPGGYLVHFPGLDSYAALNTVPMVSAQGGAGEYCNIGSWGAGHGSAYTTVYCFDYTGQPSASYFTIAYMMDRLLVC
jgi:hypothetical protein